VTPVIALLRRWWDARSVAFRKVTRTLVLLLLTGAVSLLVGLSTATASSPVGPHEAQWSTTLNSRLTLDLGPLGTISHASPAGPFGVDVVIGEIPGEFSSSQVDTDSLGQALSADGSSYLTLISRPELTVQAGVYSLVADGLRTVEVLGLGEKGRYMTALTFGNVHGVYKPGAVKLRPEVLKEIQDAVGAKHGKERPFDLVFHGGSGSSPQEISDAVDFGVVKMNIDTDTQYAFTRPVADHMLRNYDGVLKVDGEVGNKKQYDPRAWGKAAEAGMAKRVVEACEYLRSAGTHA